MSRQIRIPYFSFIRREFSPLNNLEPSCKTGLDCWDCFRRGNVPTAVLHLENDPENLDLYCWDCFRRETVSATVLHTLGTFGGRQFRLIAE